jgi:site-specific DNA-methyltransferase (adenine-specific)
MEKNKIYLGDCLELIPKHIEDKSIDMIFCDLPYGTTQCKWDSVIDLDKLWHEYKRVIKDNGVIVLFASQPFTSVLISSNLKMFKYSYTWDKITKTNHLNAKKQPLRQVEDICVFYKKQPTYKPQGLIECEVSNFRPNHFKYKKGEKVYGEQKEHSNKSTYTNYPSNLIQHSNGNHNSLHPTQKPLSLIEYMIKTYTNEGDLILDNTCGSGTTGRGAKNLNRDYIMMEQDETYYEIACKRLED